MKFNDFWKNRFNNSNAWKHQKSFENNKIFLQDEFYSHRDFRFLNDNKSEYLKLHRLLNSLSIFTKYFAIQYIIDINKNLGYIRFTPLFQFDNEKYMDFDIQKRYYNEFLKNNKKFFTILGINK